MDICNRKYIWLFCRNAIWISLYKNTSYQKRANLWTFYTNIWNWGSSILLINFKSTRTKKSIFIWNCNGKYLRVFMFIFPRNIFWYNFLGLFRTIYEFKWKSLFIVWCILGNYCSCIFKSHISSFTKN